MNDLMYFFFRDVRAFRGYDFSCNEFTTENTDYTEMNINRMVYGVGNEGTR